MRFMRRLTLPAVLTLFLLSPAAIALQGRELWVTLDAETARAAAQVLDRPGSVFHVVAEGPVTVVRVAEADLPVLSDLVHERLRRCGGFMAHESLESALREAAADTRAAEEQAPLVDYTIDNGAVVNAMLPQLQEANIRDTITQLAAYHTRYYTTQTGVAAATWLRDRWAGYAQGRSDVSVQLFNHAGWAQPSVILTITGASLPSEVVVVGGHLDSINGGATGRAPGADDDASGVASFTEALRVALASGYRPARTLKFMAYAAEEVGLRGSQEIANRHRDQGVNVVGVLQLDMTNYKGSGIDVAIITDNTNSAQNAFLRNLVDTYLGLPRADTACGYACSDHASWTRAGFVASFPFEAVMGQHNPTIHTANDTLAQSGGTANHALKFARLTTAYVAELAKGTLPGGGNQPPVVSAGPDKSAAPGTNVTLDGSGSDPDGGPSPLSFAWTQVSGPAATINNAGQAVANVTPGSAGTYVFRLTASDGAAQRSDDMTLTAAAGTTDVFFDNFETSLGWTRNLNGTDTATAGLWERGDPQGTTSSGLTTQLNNAFSGINDLVTGRLAGAAAGDHDVDGGLTSITSPPITLPASGTLTLTFRYYMAHLTNSSAADFLRVSVVGGTTSVVFTETGAANNDAAAWALATANISAFAGQTVRIRIEAADAGTGSLVEAAVDDVRITRQ